MLINVSCVVSCTSLHKATCNLYQVIWDRRSEDYHNIYLL